MGLLLLEVVLALAIAGFIVWWTMFAGRRRGERPADLDEDGEPPSPPEPPRGPKE